MDYKKHIFPNGLRLVTIPMPSVESVTVMILVGVGSRYEDKELNGISHFLEHMAFKGTKKRPTALSIASLIEGIGGEQNAFTSKDHTGFYIKAAKKHLLLLLDVLSDMLLHSKFDPLEINKEKGVIIEEINLYEDTPIRKISDLYENLLYGDSKLGRDIAGRKEVIKKITRDDFLSYTDRFYGPKNTVVAIAGGIGNNVTMKQCYNDTIEKLITKYLGGWEKKEVVAYEKTCDSQKKPAVLVRFKDTEQAHLCIGVRSFRLGHPQRYALGVLTAILGGGMSSRLFTEVREKRGLAYYIRSSNEQYQDVGNFVTQAGVDVSRIETAVEVILTEFQKIAEERVDEKELSKAKELLKGRFILELEDSRYVASLFANDELMEGKVRLPSEIMEKVDAVTSADVQKVARDIFRTNSCNLAIIGPYKEEERFNKILKLT